MAKFQLDGAERIAEVANDVWFQAWRSWSRDVLLCHPKEAAELCNLVRGRLRRPKLSDFEILWTWLNAHKRSKVALKPKARVA